MALPPEPIEELLAQARRAVVAEVVSVDPDLRSPASSARPGAFDHPIGAGPPRPPQRARLSISKVLDGPPADGTEIDVHKPEGSYVLVPGVQGVFLLDDDGHILGRHGPDGHSPAEVERALAASPVSAGGAG